MSHKDELFQLIKSMDRNEKGYFKKFATINGKKDNNYLRLFNAIDKQDTYDEKVLKQQFSGEKFAKQLHVVKNYLFRLILKSLRSYQHEANIPLRLFNALIDMETLSSRKMYASADKLLQKTQALIEAENTRRLVFMPLLYRAKNNILVTNLFTSLSDQEMLAWETEYTGHMDTLANQLKYEIQYVKMMRLYSKTPRANTPEEMAAFEAIMQQPIFKVNRQELPYTQQLLFLDTYMFYCLATKRHFAYAESSDEVVNVLKANASYIYNRPIEYLTALNNNARTNSIHLRFDKAEAALKEIKKIEPTEIRDKITRNDYVLDLETDILLRKGKKGDATKWLTANLSRCEAHLKEITPAKQFQLLHRIAMLYFKDEQYDKVLDYTNQIIQAKETKGLSLYRSSWFLMIIANYEIGNIALLPYLLKSLGLQLDKKGQNMPTERIFMSDFRKLMKLEKPKAQKILANMRASIITATPDPYELQLANTFEILIWLNNKLGLTMPQIDAA